MSDRAKTLGFEPPAQTQETKGRNSTTIEQHQSLADGLHQIGKGPTSLWLYVKDGVLHVPTRGLSPIAWLSCAVTVVNGRTFIRASDAIGLAPHYSEYVETFARARGLKL